MAAKKIGGRINMITNDEHLIDEAIKAIDLCYTCNESTKRRYGCAVLTKKGNVYRSSQYSSFNHITNIHAEMGTIYVATMNNDPEVIKMALVCSEDICSAPVSCGICLQFIHEHIVRTGEDIELIYSSIDKKQIIKKRISELLPRRWN